MSERDELAAVLAEHGDWGYGYGTFIRCDCGTHVGFPDDDGQHKGKRAHAAHLAAVVLAYLRPEVTTPEQLAALPEGTLFRSGDRLGRLWAHSASALDGGHVWADKHDALPLEVLA